MRYYVLDDSLATVKSLANIIRAKNIGEVCGYAQDPLDALEDMTVLQPDICLVDLLMDSMDGITFVEKARKLRPNTSFVMISKVTDKERVGKAYEAGIEFFITKPINIVEIERVLRSVAEKQQMKDIMDNIRGMFESTQAPGATQAAPATPQTADTPDLDILFSKLGMLGEKGTADIRAIFDYMEAHRTEYSREVLETVAESRGDSVKNVEQRVRRAIKKGLSNAAHVGLDDFTNEIYAVYADYVFDFKTLKDEMNGIRTGDGGGRVSISKFMDGLQLYLRSIQ